jgi:hypothetical protein
MPKISRPFWKTHAPPLRMADGVSRTLDDVACLKALGDAVCPQQAEFAYRVLDKELGR